MQGDCSRRRRLGEGTCTEEDGGERIQMSRVRNTLSHWLTNDLGFASSKSMYIIGLSPFETPSSIRCRPRSLTFSHFVLVLCYFGPDDSVILFFFFSCQCCVGRVRSEITRESTVSWHLIESLHREQRQAQVGGRVALCAVSAAAFNHKEFVQLKELIVIGSVIQVVPAGAKRQYKI